MPHYGPLLSILVASAVWGYTPLVSKHYNYPDGIPYKVDPDASGRGPQIGYNQCGASTEGPSSLCQTAFINSLDDFCLWGPPNPNSVVGNSEGEMVAWCTQPGRGTRVMQPGTLRGVQFMATPDYVQVVGFIDQTKINIAAGDYGGEMDPNGADQRGNPLGGLLYSNVFRGNRNIYTQAVRWHNFMGGDIFCLKACDPAGKNASRYCEHIFDRIGCAYNAPNNAQPGVFETCQGENQDFPGVYVENGATKTYQQPPESLGDISTIPYKARVPASSNCVQYQSTQLFGLGASVSIPLPPPVRTTLPTSTTLHPTLATVPTTGRSATSLGVTATQAAAKNGGVKVAAGARVLIGVVYGMYLGLG